MVLDHLMQVSNATFGRAFDKTVAEYPAKEAFVFQGTRITWEQAAVRVNMLARGLLDLGVKRGDSVGIWMTNNLEWLYSWIAIVKIGAAVGAINTRFKTTELSYALLQSDVSTLIMKDTFLGKINALGMLEELIPELSRSLSQ
ncbi:MAG: AMP-binding protein [Chloroflexota bacterium]